MNVSEGLHITRTWLGTQSIDASKRQILGQSRKTKMRKRKENNLSVIYKEQAEFALPLESQGG